MDPEELKFTISAINSQYPWATESTVSRLAELSRSNNIKSTALAAGLLKALGAADAARLQKYIEGATKEVNESIKAAQDARKNIKSSGDDLVKAMQSSSASGIEAMAELSYAGAQALDKAAESVVNGIGSFANIPGLRRFQSITTGAMVGVTGVGAVFAKLITEQEKQLRSMIDYGIVLGNTANYTTIRGQLASIGLTMENFNDLIGKSSDALTSMYGDIETGSGALLSFLRSDRARRETANFGYMPAQIADLLSQESEQLYRLNAINELNDSGQNRVLQSFQVVNSVTGYLAETLGIQRSAMLEARRQQRENIDFQLAMEQNGEFVDREFGVGARDRIREAADFLAIFSSSTLGQQFSEETMNVFNDTFSDIQIDTSPFNNMMNDQFVQQLQMMGPGVLEEWAGIIKDSATGQIGSPQEMLLRYRRFLELVRESTPLQSTDSLSVQVNQLIARSQIIPQQFFEASAEEIRQGIESQRDRIDGADDPIEIVAGMSVAFLEAQHQITPGFESMGDVMSALEWSIGGFTDFWIDLFGIGGSSAPTVEQQEDAFRNVVADINSGIVNGTVSPGSVPVGAGSGATVRVPTVAERQASLDELNEQLAEVNAELERVREARSGTITDEMRQELVERLTEERDRLTTTRDTEREELRETTALLRQLGDDISDASERVQDFEIAQQERILSRTRDELETARTRGQTELAEELERRVQELEGSLEESRTQAQPLLDEIDRLREQERAAETRRSELSQSILDANTEIRGLTTDINHPGPAIVERLREQEESLQNRATAIQAQITSAEEALQQAQERAAQAPGAGFDGLLTAISTGEGGYESSNRGTSGGRIIGSTHQTVRNGRALTDLTIAEIMQLQSIRSPSDPNRLFAVGRYQIIPSTMRAAVEGTGIDVNRRFDQETQDILGMWLVTDKRPAIGRYIRGESDDILAAQRALALEFASFPVPETMTVQGRVRQRGQSAYGSGNRALHTVEEAAQYLNQARESFLQQQQQPTTTTPTPAAPSQLTSQQQQLQQQIATIGDSQTGLNTQGEQLSNDEIARLRELEAQLAEVTRRIAEEMENNGR